MPEAAGDPVGAEASPTAPPWLAPEAAPVELWFDRVEELRSDDVDRERFRSLDESEDEDEDHDDCGHEAGICPLASGGQAQAEDASPSGPGMQATFFSVPA